jgi:hypothetical protein
MNGGNGNPPGKKGCRNSSATSVGTGGQGYVPGESGQYLGIQTPLDYCGTDGELSGEGLTCKDDTTNCWKQIGSSFTGYSFENSRKTSKNDPSFEEIRSGSITMEGKLLSFDQTLNKYIWEVKVTSWEFFSSKGKVIIDTTWQRVEIKEISKCDNVFYCNPVPNIGPAGAPRCLGGRLYFPNGRFTHAYHVEHENDPIIIDVNIVLEYSGCHAYGDIGDWVCCNNGGDGIVRNIRRDGDCP